MKLIIIPGDASVGKNDKFYIGLDLSSCNIPNDVHALQWQDTSGWIEFKDPVPNQEITSLPDWANCCVAKWDEADIIPPPAPTPASTNRWTAITKLQKTDWATIPDSSDPTKSNPYLGNPQDFIAYRNAIRAYAINPVAGDIDWPETPKAIWVTV